ncbi:MAG: glycine dehydrogenase subunit 2 [Chloroflexi bacterium]|jgi:glycine dehydrogenase subunit 2|nr:MAG: glycine dehydrogenase subunit 2 [Chloroflexota bacterium]
MAAKNDKGNNELSLLMDQTVVGRRGIIMPASDVPVQPLPDPGLLRENLDLPEVSQPQVVRYFTQLSQLNYSIDTHFYPLGSCTMKYNPKINDVVAAIPGMSYLHPKTPEKFSQGALKVMYRLQSYLSEVTGMSATSLASMAGAQGELAGVLMIRAYHERNGDSHRKLMLIPDSAHGTNPASAAMGGFAVKAIPSDSNGNMDLGALKELVGSDLAGIMLTLPSTLGLFETDIVEICDVVHKAGGLVYGDGANMNAILGQLKLGDLGFDVVHINLHKTFSTPHGGGGPGAGPVSVAERLVPFLPLPTVVEKVDQDVAQYSLVKSDHSIGRLGAFHGNFGVLIRAYAYIRSLGADGLRQISRDAVINANYLLARLKESYDVSYDRLCMHEVVLSARRQKKNGVRGLDIAKRLLDYGFHAPTMYFPLIVDEALMVEPTESESKETLDAFIDAMLAIATESENIPETVRGAPYSTPVSRLDEAKAAREPDLRWQSR